MILQLQKIEKLINSELSSKIKNSSIKNEELIIEIAECDLIDTIQFLKSNESCKFKQLIDIAGVDYPENEKRFELVYLFLSHEHNLRINQQGKKVTSNQISNMSNINQSLNLGKNCDDLVYFVEDDYLHKKDAIEEMIFSYERISTQIGKELIMCPADYPYLYNKIENSKIILGNNCHWRSVEESLCTFLTSKKIIDKYFKKFVSACEFEHYPFEKPFHDIYQKELCISPMPAIAVHFTNINSIYGLSPLIDYEELWEENKI